MKTILTVLGIAALASLFAFMIHITPQNEAVANEVISIDEPTPNVVVTLPYSVTQTCETRTHTVDTYNDRDSNRAYTEIYKEVAHNLELASNGRPIHHDIMHVASHDFLVKNVEVFGGQFVVDGALFTHDPCEYRADTRPQLSYAQVTGLCNDTTWELTSDFMNITYVGETVGCLTSQ